MNLSKLIHKLIHLNKRDFVFFWQRMTRGWDDSDTWSLDYTVAALILPRLRRFKELNIGYPSELTRDDWDLKLDKMIAAFEFAASDSRWSCKPGDYEKHQEGLDLFAKYFFGLWW